MGEYRIFVTDGVRRAQQRRQRSVIGASAAGQRRVKGVAGAPSGEACGGAAASRRPAPPIPGRPPRGPRGPSPATVRPGRRTRASRRDGSFLRREAARGPMAPRCSCMENEPAVDWESPPAADASDRVRRILVRSCGSPRRVGGYRRRERPAVRRTPPRATGVRGNPAGPASTRARSLGHRNDARIAVPGPPGGRPGRPAASVPGPLKGPSSPVPRPLRSAPPQSAW
ncbi:hypothetical protein ABIA33_000145 [Streptacidiphilus sp. MAP12-16]